MHAYINTTEQEMYEDDIDYDYVYHDELERDYDEAYEPEYDDDLYYRDEDYYEQQDC